MVVRYGKRARVVVASIAVTCVTSCGIIFGLDGLEYDAVDGGVSAAASTDASDASDAGTNAETSFDAEVPFDDKSRWTSYRPKTVNGAAYQAGPFDGRFVYFILFGATAVPSEIVRYDTSASFDDAAAWTAAAVRPIADVSAIRTLVFDGRYLTLPGLRLAEAGVPTGLTLRYDTQRPEADFLQPSSWEVFDTKALNSAAIGYIAAATIDGGVYLGPPGSVSPYLRHDAVAALDAGWTEGGASNTCAIAGLNTVIGAGCAGPYLYFVGACATRYDLRLPFTDPSAWSNESLLAIGVEHTGYQGTISTPSHVYATQVGFTDGGDGKWRIARIAPTAAFDAGFESREIAKTNTLLTGTLGGAFDGRYVYFAPFPRGTPTPGAVYLRFDTQKPFDDDSAWSFATAQALGLAGPIHRGAVFDGTYVYFAPAGALVPFVRYRANDLKQPFTQPCSTF